MIKQHNRGHLSLDVNRITAQKQQHTFRILQYKPCLMEKSWGKAKKDLSSGIFQMSEGGFPDLVALHTNAADQTASQSPELSGKAPN